MKSTLLERLRSRSVTWPVILFFSVLLALVVAPGSAQALVPPPAVLSPSIVAQRAAAAGGGSLTRVAVGGTVRSVATTGLSGCTTLNAAACGATLAGTLIIGVGVTYIMSEQERFVRDTWARGARYAQNVSLVPTPGSYSLGFDTNCESGNARAVLTFTNTAGSSTSDTLVTAGNGGGTPIFAAKPLGTDPQTYRVATTNLYDYAPFGSETRISTRIFCGTILLYATNTAGAVTTSTDTPTTVVPRVITTTGQCVTPDGGVSPSTPVVGEQYAASATATGVTIPPVSCPSGSSPGSATATECAVGTPEPHCVVVAQTPPVEETVGGTDPTNPCGPAGGWACTADIWKRTPDGHELQCGSQVACPAPRITPSPSDPNTGVDPDGGEYSCIRASSSAWDVVPFARCGDLVGNEPTTDTPTVTPGTPTTPRPVPGPISNPSAPPRPYPAPTPNGDPTPDPSPSPTPTPSPTGSPSPTPTTTPGTDPLPPEFPLDYEDPEVDAIPDLRACVPTGWAILNPVAFVQGAGCVLVWAFVPRELPELVAGAGVDASGRVPFSWAFDLGSGLAPLVSPSCGSSCSLDYRLTLALLPGVDAVPVLVNTCPPNATSAAQCTPGSWAVQFMADHRGILTVLVVLLVVAPVGSLIIDKMWPTN